MRHFHVLKTAVSFSAAAILTAVSLVSCEQKDWKNADLPPEERASILLGQMTLEEKIGQMCQYVAPCYVPPGEGSPYKNIDAADENLGNADLADKIRKGEVGAFLHVLTSKEAAALQTLVQESRLQIPLLIGVDAIHGNALHEGCTVYPTNINMASTFNPELLEVIGTQTADEMRQTGMYWTFSPNIDVARDARWGRMGETFGEDSYLVSQMGKFLVWGLQGRNQEYSQNHVIACAKHLIGGGEPAGGINAAPMDMSERKMRELYLPPFVTAIKEAGVATVMAAHNEVNGVPCHGNAWLLKDILRDELGFDGFVVSDWMDIERLHSMHHWAKDSTDAFVRSLEAGIDMHMQGDNYFEAILDAVESGRIPESRIDEAAGKILGAKFALGLFENPVPEVKTSIDGVADHRKTALEAARQSIVLLKNDGILPLKNARRIFVVGPNSDSQTIMGDWAAPQKDDDVITVVEGIKESYPESSIDTMCFGGRISNVNSTTIKTAAHKAASADVNIVVVGDNSQRYSTFGRTCGENCDRDNLDLPGEQQALLEAVAQAGKPVILVLMSGRALSVGWAKENVNAIIEAWEPGMMGGQALAEIMSGMVNPSGKLPVTVPQNVGQVQTVYNHKHSQYSRQFALSETGPLWEFGFGLSYSTFSLNNPKFSGLNSSELEIYEGEIVNNSVTVELVNNGPYDGDEVVQLYVRDEYASVTRPVKELKAFKRVSLKNGERTSLTFDLTPEMFQCWSASNRWEIEPGDFTILIGTSSADSNLSPLKITIK